MTDELNEGQWVWVMIQDPQTPDENIVGQYDPDNEISFIPVFREKEEALKCFHLITRDKARKYEFQAILYEDLRSEAAEGDFQLFILDGDGAVQDRIQP